MNLLFLIPLLLALIFSYAVYQDRRLVFLPAMAWTSVTCFVRALRGQVSTCSRDSFVDGRMDGHLVKLL